MLSLICMICLEGACEVQEFGTWQNPGANARSGASLENVKAKAGIIVDSKDTMSWPSIGDKDEICVVSSNQSSNSGSSLSAANPNSQVLRSSGDSTSKSHPDNTNLKSVIPSSANLPDRKDGSQDTSGQSGDQQWLDTASLSWESKQHGNSTQGNPNNVRHENGGPAGSNQFSSWNQSSFPTAFSSSGEPAAKWGPPGSNSAWSTPSPTVSKAADWGIPSNSSSTPWGPSKDDSWGPAKRAPNSGIDSWSQPSLTQPPQTPSAVPNPSTTSPAQWGLPTSPPSSSTSWSNSTAQSSQPQPSTPGAGTASPRTTQWNSNPSSAPMASTASSPVGSSSSSTGVTDSKLTSWAGAAAKGLPKPPPKLQEILDPVQLQIQQSINSTEGWGRVPVRQDTSWGELPEKKKQDDSNTWQSTPNNGTAIWEASKAVGGSGSGANTAVTWEDKSTWNQKVIGNDDPNVWNGPGSKGKDNAMWDEVSQATKDEPSDQTNTWNAISANQPPVSQHRTNSQSSGDTGSENSWSGGVRASPPSVSGNQVVGPSAGNGENTWNSSDSKQHNWSSETPAIRPSSISTDAPNAAYWNDSNVPGKTSSNWNQSNGSWLESNSPTTALNRNDNAPDNWSQPPVGSGGWGDGPGTSQYKGKTSFAWDDNSAGPVGDFRRQFKSESDTPQTWDDADMGDWNESNSVWSSAGGFKRPTVLLKPNHMPEVNKITSHYNSGVGSGGGGGGGGGGSPQLTRSQMIGTLVSLGFHKDDALRALISNDMNLQNAISELYASNSIQAHNPHGPMMGGLSSSGMGGGMAGPFAPNDKTFNAHMQSPNPVNSSLHSAAQLQAKSIQGSSRISKPSPQTTTIVGRSNAVQQHQQRAIVNQLQLGVRMGNIHPQILNLPLTDQNLRSIHQLLNLQNNYHQHHNQIEQMQQRGRPNLVTQQQIDSMLSSIRQQMMSLQGQMLKQPQMSKMPDNSIGDQFSSLSITGPSTSSSQSRLSQWKLPVEPEKHDRAPGARFSNINNNLHASHSTPNLQGTIPQHLGILNEHGPWSTTTGSSGSNWSMPYGDNEAQSGLSSANNSISQQQSNYDIPEFIPGQPWQGANTPKIEDDPTVTPGSVARSLSITTSAAPGRLGSDLGWSGLQHRNTWSTAGPASPGGEMWNKSRPPPGFNKNMNRSLSMPQGPSHDKSAFSPVGTGWDGQSQSSTWLVLRNLTPQIDGATLKTLCLQHGPLLNFFVNQSNGQALVQYSSKGEGLKAQKSLNQCVLGNTTIMAEFVDESEVQRIIDQCHRQGNMVRANSMAAPSSALWSGSSSSNLWSSGSGTSSGSAWGGSLLDSMSGGLLPLDYGIGSSSEYSM